MSKHLTQWFPYHVGDMTFRMQHCNHAAEGIATRLMCAYYRRESDIPTDNTVLAYLARVTPAEFKKHREQVGTVIDIAGPVLRIPFLDDELAKAKAISEKRTKAANARWKSEGNSHE